LTRGALAGKVDMTVNSLFCVENGIAKVGDISTGQLLALKALAGAGEGTALVIAIEEYVASFGG
jgi:hypothetical protein